MKIGEIRSEIDITDSSIVKLLLKRLRLSEKAAEYKIKNSLPVFDEEREKEIIKKISKEAGEELADYVVPVYSALLCSSRKRQDDIMDTVREKK